MDIENVAEDFSCWQRYGGNLSSKSKSGEEPEGAGIGWGSGTDHAGTSASQGNEQGWQWFKDPRLDILGYRGIFPSITEREFSHELHSKEKLWILSRNFQVLSYTVFNAAPLVEADKETAEENYLLWRLEKGVAEGSTEIPKGGSSSIP